MRKNSGAGRRPGSEDRPDGRGGEVEQAGRENPEVEDGGHGHDQNLC